MFKKMEVEKYIAKISSRKMVSYIQYTNINYTLTHDETHLCIKHNCETMYCEIPVYAYYILIWDK